jgi:hypothetical protein
MFTQKVSQEKYIFVVCVKKTFLVVQNCYLHDIFGFLHRPLKMFFSANFLSEHRMFICTPRIFCPNFMTFWNAFFIIDASNPMSYTMSLISELICTVWWLYLWISFMPKQDVICRMEFFLIAFNLVKRSKLWFWPGVAPPRREPKWRNVKVMEKPKISVERLTTLIPCQRIYIPSICCMLYCHDFHGVI